MKMWKRVVQNSLGRLGYQVSKSSGGSSGTNPYHAAVLALLARKPTISVVVVGANDGKINDPLFDLVKSSLSERVSMLLVEPQRELIPILQRNYDFVENKQVVNCAVGPDGCVGLFTIRQDYWKLVDAPYAKAWPIHRAPTGVASTNKAHVVKWASQYLRGYNPETVITELFVDRRPLCDILEAQGILKQIDVLQIDVEGSDDSVIYSSDLPNSRPALIHFELGHLSSARKRGLLEYLSRHGYENIRIGMDCLAIRQQPLPSP